LLKAARAAFAEGGLEGARVDDIARRAGINKQLVYHYFGSKDALYTAVIEEVYHEIREQEAALALGSVPRRVVLAVGRQGVATVGARITADLDAYLAAPFLDAEVKKIDRRRAAPWPAPYGEGDTIWMGAADASGLVVSYIQSIYWEFGSGCVLPATGVLMQNRGASFSLDPKAVNALSPGRLPFHTLNPALAVLDDGRVMAYGTMGGDGQPQTQAMLFARHILYRQPLDQALAAPRWLLGRTWGSVKTNLRMENRFDGNLIEQLLSAGHDVEVIDEAYSDTMGHAGAGILHPSGVIEGGHDPRADGGAAGV